MKKNLYIIILVIFVHVFVLLQWTRCTDFALPVHFSSFDLQLRLIEGIHNDVGVPLGEVRIFHNKVTGSLFDIFGQYIQFWNITFLARFVSLAGIVGLGAGFYYFFTKKKNKVLWLGFGYLLGAPFIEIFGFTKLPYLFRLVLIAMPFVIWSVFGYWNLLQGKKLSVRGIVFLLIVSVWYFLALQPVLSMCSV